MYIDSNSRSSGDLADTELEANLRRHSRNFTLSPETTDYDSNCGDLDSLSNDINCPTDYGKLYTSMPVLEDGLSSGHASDTENNVNTAVENEKQIFDSNCAENVPTQTQTHQYQVQQQCKPPTILQNNEYNASFSHECHDNCISNCLGNTVQMDGNLISDLIDVPENIIQQQQQQKQQQQQTHQPDQQLCSHELLHNDSSCCNNNSDICLNTSNELGHNDSNYDAVYAPAMSKYIQFNCICMIAMLIFIYNIHFHSLILFSFFVCIHFVFPFNLHSHTTISTATANFCSISTVRSHKTAT